MADVTSPFGFPYPEDTDLVRDGAQDIENLATGVNDYLTGGYLYAGTIYYTSSGNFVKADPFGTGNIGLRAIRVRCVGAGGGGGGSGTDKRGASGGGGGGYAESFITDIAGLDASVTVTRGAGGAGGAAGNNNGSAGGASSFGSLVIAAGGGFGPHPDQDFPVGGEGGLSNTGQLVIDGSGGGASVGVGDGNPQPSGHGGSSHMGGGAPGSARLNGLTTNGIVGRRYGGGGGGGVRWNVADAPGGAGADGIVIVDCFV